MSACEKCGGPTFGRICAACQQKMSEESPIVQPHPTELLEAGNGMVYIIEDRVALEISDFRIEFPPDVADTVARYLMRAAKKLREGKAKHGDIIA